MMFIAYLAGGEGREHAGDEGAEHILREGECSGVVAQRHQQAIAGP